MRRSYLIEGQLERRSGFQKSNTLLVPVGNLCARRTGSETDPPPESLESSKAHAEKAFASVGARGSKNEISAPHTRNTNANKTYLRNT